MIKKSLIFVVILSLFFPSLSSGAEFNPNIVIHDSQMKNWQTMDRSDIQIFLQGKKSYLSKYKTLDAFGVERQASDIIYQAAKEHKVNPHYLLARLQTEQSLITDTDPTEKQLDWATGYGVCDSCKTTDPAIQKHKGFGNQVESAANFIEWCYENMDRQTWIKRSGITYTIDSVSVTPVSDATGFLYNYTPHLHGNKLIWNFMYEWFQQFYPNGTLITTQGSPDIYVIQNGQKHRFQNMTALTTRYDPKLVINVAESELSRYPTGSEYSLPNYSIVYDGSTYYLLDYDYKRPFASYEVIREIGYHPDEILTVTQNDITDYTTGTAITSKNKNPFGKLVELQENGKLYYLKDNTYQPIIDKIIATANFPGLNPEKISASELQNYKQGDLLKFKDGILFGIKGIPEIFVTENGQKRHISTAEIFNGMGYNWKNVLWIDSEYVSTIHKAGEPVYVDTQIINSSTPKKAEETIASETESESSTTNVIDYLVRTPQEKIKFVGPEFATTMEAYLVADAETLEILTAKNPDFPRPPASLTKVMTAYQLMKGGLNLNNVVTYNPALHRAEYHYYRIAEGEQVKNSDLMSAMLDSSLNTAARMLVNQNKNQEKEFLARMNSQVKEWGLTQTNFVDVSGISEQNHTTPREYLKIFSTASANKTLKEYMGAISYEYVEVHDVDGNPNHFDKHSNKLVHENHPTYTILTSKTGFTYDAGPTLAMLIKRTQDGRQFYIITMGDTEFDNNARYNEPRRLIEWALEQF